MIFSSLISNIYYYFILNYKEKEQNKDENIKINNANKESFFEGYPKINLGKKKQENLNIEEEKKDKIKIEDNLKPDDNGISDNKKNLFLKKMPILKSYFRNDI